MAVNDMNIFRMPGINSSKYAHLKKFYEPVMQMLSTLLPYFIFKISLKLIRLFFT